jgi:uncharacterized phiE125 gp8 family phage protein
MIRAETVPRDDDILAILSVADAKKNMRVMHSREDDVIRDCILDAYHYLDGVDGFLRKPILPATFGMSLKTFDRLGELPFPNALDILDITYRAATTDLPVTVDPAAYELINDDGVSYLRYSDTFAFPQLNSNRPQPIKVRFTAGYQDTTFVPRELRRAMLLLSGFWYHNRETAQVESGRRVVPDQIAFGVDALCRYHVAVIRLGAM